MLNQKRILKQDTLLKKLSHKLAEIKKEKDAVRANELVSEYAELKMEFLEEEIIKTGFPELEDWNAFKCPERVAGNVVALAEHYVQMQAGGLS